MFRHTIPIGRIFGIPIELDYSWFLIAALVTWLLAASYYPAEFPGSARSEYWLMGAITAVLFFASIIIHELAHSLVALRYKIPISRITLFIFGGVSQIAGEPPSASAEFLIAIAGPATSIALAVVFRALETPLQGAPALVAVAKYLSLINLALGIFNLVPGFPLDGGRVFRAIVWGANKNFRRATSIAAQTGRFFGYLFIMLGVWQVLTGRVGNGLWIAFIGWFLESAASAQVQQQTVQGLLAGHHVSEAMNPTCARVPADASLQELVDEQVLGHGVRCFLVTQDEEVVGLLTVHNLKAAPRSAWGQTTARDVMVPLRKLEKIDPNAELWTVLQRMGRDGMNQLPVVSGNRVIGLLSRADIVNYLQTLAQIDVRAV
jgi:Zn-dependent protease